MKAGQHQQIILQSTYRNKLEAIADFKVDARILGIFGIRGAGEHSHAQAAP
jgi:hypothetical protein